MKTIAISAAAALCAALLLSKAVSQSPDSAPEKPADENAPQLAPYRVMPAFGSIPRQPSLRGEGEKNRKAFEDALNKADAEGYQFAGVHDQWIVLKRKSETTPRHRVVLPPDK